MAKKIFKYRGMTIEELQALDEKAFAALIPSRARRTLLRGKGHQEKVMIEKLQKGKSPKTHARDVVITPMMVGKTIKVHNGKEFVPVEVVGEMLGHFLGEFAQSRKKVSHSGAGVGATKSSGSVGRK